jgi:hypothetical protein
MKRKREGIKERQRKYKRERNGKGERQKRER